MLPRVTTVKPEADYTLLLTFRNGEVRRYDAKPLPHMFQELRDVAVFNAVKACDGTVHWGADGELDICPDTLYLRSVAA